MRTILMETGLAPSHLELELTETSLMQDSKSTTTVLQGLKEVGDRLALYDFGTGYSNLSYLKHFPLDILKIDSSFLGNLDDAVNASIVSAVISMGKSLKMRIVAEGVETPEHLAFLQAQHCREGQGVYLSRPRVAAEFTESLEHKRIVTHRQRPESASAR